MRAIARALLVMLALLISGCGTPANYPTGYSGPLASRNSVPVSKVQEPGVLPPRPSVTSGTGSTCRSNVARENGLTEEDIRACMDANNGALQAIYQRSLRRDPTIEGVVIFTMRISPSGEVDSLKLDPRTKVSGEFANKILERVRLIKFPSSTEAWEGQYTFNFFPS